MIGGTVGSVAHELLPGYTGTPGAYALVGMGTAFAGIVRTPLTSVVMIFEITRDYTIVVPLMISNLISYYVSSKLQPTPIYEVLAEQDGIHLPSGTARATRKVFTVQQAMDTTVELTAPTLKARELLSTPQTVWLIGADGSLLPVVDRANVRALKGIATVDGVMRAYKLKTATGKAPS